MTDHSSGIRRLHLGDSCTFLLPGQRRVAGQVEARQFGGNWTRIWDAQDELTAAFQRTVQVEEDLKAYKIVL
jgi:hypothetical protein